MQMWTLQLLAQYSGDIMQITVYSIATIAIIKVHDDASINPLSATSRPAPCKISVPRIPNQAQTLPLCILLCLQQFFVGDGQSQGGLRF